MKLIDVVIIVAMMIAGSLSVCYAQTDHIGIVKTVSGEAVLERDGVAIPVVPEARLQPGDILETKTDGRMGIIFEDDTIVSIGPNSKFVIKDFLFQPAEKKMSFVVKLLHGTISYLSGQIAKLSPENVRLETPDATIGIRGTHVLLKVG